MKRYFKIALIGLFALASCKKAELKKPVDLSFKVSYLKENGGQGFSLQSGEVNLSMFDVSGDRIEGNNISFERSLESAHLVDLKKTQNVDELDYNLPQGEYTSLQFKCRAEAEDDIQSIVIKGTYVQDGQATLDVRFETSEIVDFVFPAVENSSGKTIILDKSKEENITLEFGIDTWFESISESAWMNANVTIENNKNVIILNSSNNTSLYEAAFLTMEENNKAIF